MPTTSPVTTFERIAAGDVAPGDRVARSRTHTFEEVASVERGPVSVRFLNAAGQTIARPRATASWWVEREVEPEPPLEPLAPEVQALVERRAEGTLEGGCRLSLAEVRLLEDSGLMTGYSIPNPLTSRGKAQRGYLWTEAGQERVLIAQEARLANVEGWLSEYGPRTAAARALRRERDALREVLSAAGRLEA